MENNLQGSLLLPRAKVEENSLQSFLKQNLGCDKAYCPLIKKGTKWVYISIQGRASVWPQFLHLGKDQWFPNVCPFILSSRSSY